MALFAGDATLADRLTAKLVEGLRSFGFDVTGPEQVAAVLPSADPAELQDAALRSVIANRLSIEWLFTGILERDPQPSGPIRVRVRVADLSTGRLAWAIDRGQQSPGGDSQAAAPLDQDLDYVMELFSRDVLHRNQSGAVESPPAANRVESTNDGSH